MLTDNTPFARSYAREVLVLDHGQGVYLFDESGKRYLDFGAGIAVNALGYGDRRLARITGRQTRRLVHTSNLYTTRASVTFAEEVMAATASAARAPFDAVFFGNSGTEANEAAIKFARLYARTRRGDEAHQIVSFENAFHGRTMGALAATPKKKYREKFEPLPAGFRTIAHNDPASIRDGLDDNVAAVIVEPIQGEGGLTVLSRETADTLNRVTAERDILLIADEIQTGLGRTGALLGSELVGLKPDIVTLAKPLAGGLPLSATLIPDRVNTLLNVGDHGSTFGGGPVTTAAGSYVLSRITAPGFLDRVRAVAALLESELMELVRRFGVVKGLKGAGLLRGLELVAADHVGSVMAAARERGLLVLRSGEAVVRIAPPLIITEEQIRRGVALLAESLATIETKEES